MYKINLYNKFFTVSYNVVHEGAGGRKGLALDFPHDIEVAPPPPPSQTFGTSLLPPEQNLEIPPANINQMRNTIRL